MNGEFQHGTPEQMKIKNDLYSELKPTAKHSEPIHLVKRIQPNGPSKASKLW